jgi:hypothetical protein
MVPVDKLPPATQLNVTDFPRKSGILSEKELIITGMSATALVAAMGEGKLSAEEVVVAFLKRAVIGHQLVCLSKCSSLDKLLMLVQLNFATEFMAEKAIARARELDRYFERTGKLVGPLVCSPNYVWGWMIVLTVCSTVYRLVSRSISGSRA